MLSRLFISVMIAVFIGTACPTAYGVYSAEQGRWLTRDPSDGDSVLQKYTYVSSNPINGKDPTGLSTLKILPPDKAHKSTFGPCGGIECWAMVQIVGPVCQGAKGYVVGRISITEHCDCCDGHWDEPFEIFWERWAEIPAGAIPAGKFATTWHRFSNATAPFTKGSYSAQAEARVLCSDDVPNGWHQPPLNSSSCCGAPVQIVTNQYSFQQPIGWTQPDSNSANQGCSVSWDCCTCSVDGGCGSTFFGNCSPPGPNPTPVCH